MRRSTWYAGLSAVLLCGLLVHLPQIDRPFINLHDWASAHQAQFARNHLRYGLGDTWGRCIYSRHVHALSGCRLTYPDHPPLLTIVLAGSLALLGENEIAVRTVPTLCTVAVIGLTLAIVAPLLGRGRTLLVGIILVLLPLLAHGGHVANHEPLALAFALLAVRGYLGWRHSDLYQGGARWNATMQWVGTVLMILAGWVGLLFAAAIWLDFALGGKGRPRRWTGWLLVTLPAGLAAAATFAHVLWTMGWSGADLAGLLAFRAGFKATQQTFDRASLGHWALQQLLWMWFNWATAGVLLALIGLGVFIARRRRSRTAMSGNGNAVPTGAEHGSRRPAALSVVLLLSLPGLLFVAIFRSGSFEHNYWWLHVTPLVGLLAAEGMLALGAWSARRMGWLAGYGVVVLGLLALGGESLYRRGYYMPQAGVTADLWEACAFVRSQTTPDMVVFGNRQFWAVRPYYAGPMSFMIPQAAWYLDRCYVYAPTAELLSRAAGTKSFYILAGGAGREAGQAEAYAALVKQLRERHRVARSWPGIEVYQLVE